MKRIDSNDCQLICHIYKPQTCNELPGMLV